MRSSSGSRYANGKIRPVLCEFHGPHPGARPYAQALFVGKIEKGDSASSVTISLAALLELAEATTHSVDQAARLYARQSSRSVGLVAQSPTLSQCTFPEPIPIASRFP
jgi:hypothetical protein